VQRGYLDLDEIKVIHASEDDFDALRLLPGDVLFTEGGDRDKLGRGWVWNGEVPDCIHQNHIFRARLFSPSVQPKFVSYHGNTFGQEWFTKAGKQTTNLASINLGMLRQFPVALPPADEQHVIVEALEAVIANINEAEKEVQRGLARAARLRQSILKQAFEGRLVAQDAADEPASVLLARIRQQRMAVPSSIAGRSEKPVKIPREVFMRRASIVSYTVRRLSAHKSFGRTQLEKTVHLTQSHLGVDLGFVFERYAAGPFDKSIYKLEAVAKKNDWFTTQNRPTFGVTYHPGTKIDQMCQYAPGHLGDRQAALDSLLDQIAGMNTDEAELFATAYAAWNDLLIDGRPADDEAIIAEVHGWHEEKKKFGPDVIRDRLKWMRQNGYVPTGQGQRTRLVEKATKLKSRRRMKGDASA
jgi:type I restriction enzyme S subunit